MAKEREEGASQASHGLVHKSVGTSGVILCRNISNLWVFCCTQLRWYSVQEISRSTNVDVGICIRVVHK